MGVVGKVKKIFVVHITLFFSNTINLHKFVK